MCKSFYQNIERKIIKHVAEDENLTNFVMVEGLFVKYATIYSICSFLFQ